MILMPLANFKTGEGLISGLARVSSEQIFTDRFIEFGGFKIMRSFPTSLDDVLEPSQSRKFKDPKYDGLPIYSCYTNDTEHIDIEPHVKQAYKVLREEKKIQELPALGRLAGIKGGLFNCTAAADFFSMARERLSYNPRAACVCLKLFEGNQSIGDLDMATPDVRAEIKTSFIGDEETLIRQMGLDVESGFHYSFLIAPENSTLEGIMKVLKRDGDNFGLLTTPDFNGGAKTPMLFNKDLFHDLFGGLSDEEITYKMLTFRYRLGTPREIEVETDPEPMMVSDGKMHGSIMEKKRNHFVLN